MILFLFIYLFKFYFIYFWLRWVFVAAQGLFSSCGKRGLFFVAVFRLLFEVASLVAEHGPQSMRASVVVTHGLSSCGARALGHTGFNSCGMWASVVVACRLQQLWLVGSRAQAQQLWLTGLIALRHVGSSWTRAQTRVPCIGRRILNHCATREVPQYDFF